MWRQLKNLVMHLQTYPALSPDLGERQVVNRHLKTRPPLSAQEWYIRYWTPPAVPRPMSSSVIEFAYKHLKTYSGLDSGRLQPQDRLVEDLQFPLVCWFDWGLTLCDDFYEQFGIDLTETFDETQFRTLADLIAYLEAAAHS